MESKQTTECIYPTRLFAMDPCDNTTGSGPTFQYDHGGQTRVYRISMVFARGTTAQRNSDIFQPNGKPFVGAIGKLFLLMQDNAHIMQEIYEENIEIVDRPSMSPNLNPIEHAWDI